MDRASALGSMDGSGFGYDAERQANSIEKHLKGYSLLLKALTETKKTKRSKTKRNK